MFKISLRAMSNKIEDVEVILGGGSKEHYPPIFTSTADIGKGRRIFMKQCAQCHTYTHSDGHHQNGPNLYGVVGRMPGTVGDILSFLVK